jgi:N-acetylglucosamine malate deacetylase 1
MKVDILAIGVHPDDVELSCAGTLLKHIASGYSAGILDLTEGEMGTRGTPELRRAEAKKSAEILGVAFREIMTLNDGLFTGDNTEMLEIVKRIRKYRPDIVLCNAVEDRHPDHGRASKLISNACFYAGLRRIATIDEGRQQEAWRPKAVYHYIQDRHISPDFVVDVTPFVEKKIESIQAFSSQFFDPDSKEPVTPISTASFMDFVKAKMRVMGRDINVEFAEGFTVERVIGVEDILALK